MRECRDCLHYRDNYCLVHQSEKYKGCESYWPKDGAKCETCRFHDENGSCHLSRHVHIQAKDLTFIMETKAIRTNDDWFCENWRAKE